VFEIQFVRDRSRGAELVGELSVRVWPRRGFAS
jgi:hypothetical protein